MSMPTEPRTSAEALGLNDDGCFSVLGSDGVVVGDTPESEEPSAGGADVDMYVAMRRLRACDARAAALRAEGRIGPYAGAAGEEATLVASAMALGPEDWIFPGRRDHGLTLVRDVDGGAVARFFHHLFATGGDPAKGRPGLGGTTARGARIASAGGPAAGHLCHAVGFAWAARARGEDVVTLASGRGAGVTAGASFHDALNFAGVLRAPVVFVGRYEARPDRPRKGEDDATSSSVPAATVASGRVGRFPSARARGEAYGVPGIRCDGMDPLAVYRVVRDAVRRARRGEGASWVEAVVHPLDGVRGAALDPLVRLRRYLVARGRWDDEAERALEARTQGQIDAAVSEAGSAPGPARATLFEDVYRALPPFLVAQRDAVP
ncbi:MAG: thiamine pyrophosphate-dependent enzyme [Myxococcota bacterium]